MKVFLYILLGIITLVALFAGGFIVYLKFFEGPKEAISELEPQALFDEHVLELITQYSKDLREDTQLSFAMIKEDEPEFYGLQRSSDALHTISNQHLVFEIGSITKVMTAYIIHHLALEGQLDQNNSILQYLPISNNQLQDIPVKSLINHTSGLPRLPDNLDLGISNGTDPYKSYTKEDLYDYLEGVTIEEKDKGENPYSNLAYGILGAIAEEITGERIEDLYSELLFKPLGMHNSGYHIDDVEQLAPPGRMPFGAEANYWNWDILGACGAIKSSADQMAKFTKHLLEQGEEAQMLQTWSFDNSEHSASGLGIFINTKKTNSIYWHNGATGGFNSCMIYSPKDTLGLIVLTNRSMVTGLDNGLDAMSFKIFRHLQTKLLK